MTSDAALRLVLTALLLTTEVLLTSGRDLEDGFYSSSALLGSDEELNSRPQIYGLYLESAKESGPKFRDVVADKRSRLFVGKRFPSTAVDADADEYIVVSSLDAGGSPFVVGGGGEEFKRNHLFVGKRGSPRFVGKRSVVGLLTRAKRFAENEDPAKDSAAAAAAAAAEAEGGEDDDDSWKKTWVGGGGGGGEEDVKRSRMFVGKRRGAEHESELDAKRSRLFVGRRSGLFRQPWREADVLFSAEGGGGGAEEEKRSRLFVGKRPSNDHRGQKVAESPVTDLDKRSRLFPGKRPAPGFVGKRPAPGFVGKRDA